MANKNLAIEEYDDDYGQRLMIVCPYCGNSIFDLDDYVRCYTNLDAEYEYSKGDHYERIIENKFYIPEDNYNQSIEYCHCCGNKLQWKNLYKQLHKIGYLEVK